MLCVSLALVGLLLVRRLVSLQVRESANAVTGITFGATYVLYGITLAFSLYIGNQEFSDARETVEREAGSLEETFELAGQLPQPERARVQDLVESYAREVVEEEWPMMAEGAESQRADLLIDELQRSVAGFKPDTSAEQTLYSQRLTAVSVVEAEREIRLLHSSQNTHALLWYILVAGGVITVLHSFFFGTKAVWLQALSVAALTTVVVLILTATYQIQDPFGGSVRVEPEAFEEVLDEIQRHRLEG